MTPPSNWQITAKRRSRSLARGAAGVLHDPHNWRCELELARLQGLPAFEPGVTRLLGTEVAYTHPQSIVVQYRAIFQQECYRFRSERVDPVIFDCGANIGLATLSWLRQYPMATVVAFEPDARIFGMFSGNVAGAGVAGRVHAEQSAVWVEDGTMSFHGQGAGGGHLGSGETTVATVRLARVLDEHLGRSGSPIDLLKMDIEGAEVDVLVDCAPHLTSIQRLFVEYHSIAGKPQRFAELVDVVQGSGFRLSIQTEMVSKLPFVDIEDHDGMDMQLNIWATRDPL